MDVCGETFLERVSIKRKRNFAALKVSFLLIGLNSYKIS